MALTVIPEVSESYQQTIFKEEEETISYPSSTPGSQSGTIPKPKFDLSKEDISKTEPTREDIPFSFEQRIRLGFNRPPKPWLPPRLLQKLASMRRTQLKREEMVELIEQIAKISIDFYQVKPRAFIAMKFDGRIVDSADTEIDLLLRIQGKRFDMPVIVWEAGSESFSGWRT
ncbi:MAG: hypothetical protein OEW62_00340 [Candidatus Bathyarchaeota archaeon]|nr:hypothetical protein [Candidatus Bathyarchaeota archaeon]MDH5745401.1 hypothetical protein [Candidatus Bathyarchaeota archaeon]